LGDLVNLGNSGHPSLPDVVSSVVGFGSQQDQPGFPNLVAPMLTILTPNQGQVVGTTVMVSGIVSNPLAGIEVNGQPVSVAIGPTSGYFTTTIPTPANGTITVQAANAWGVVSTQVVTVNLAFSTTPMVAASKFRACALASSGHVFCWGDGPESPVEIDAGQQKGVGPFLSNIVSIAVGTFDTCALSSSGNVYCWVGGSPVEIFAGAQGGGTYLSNITAVTVGYHFACALSSSGGVFCWGSNDFGQLGNNSTSAIGETVESSIPDQVMGVGGSGFLSNITALSAGSFHACAVSSSGNVFCWGLNQTGQLGINTNHGPENCVSGTVSESCSKTPVEVLDVIGGNLNLSNISAIAASQYIACAVSSPGHVYCWGIGAVGNGIDAEQDLPVEVISGQQGRGSFLSDITSVASGFAHACALSSSGNVYCWAENSASGIALGNTFTFDNTPVKVLAGAQGIGSFLSVISSVAAGYQFTCALSTPSTGLAVYCWGYNGGASLGNGSFTDSPIPVAVIPPPAGW